MLRSHYLDAVRAELSATYPLPQWPLHWSKFALTRSEQDFLLHETKFRDKWPTMMDAGFAPPPSANAEQASSEATATWKAAEFGPCNDGRVLDLTGGSGVDSWAFEARGAQVTCCETDPYLAELLRWNGQSRHRTVHEGPAETFDGGHFDLVYADPSRRAVHGERLDWNDLGTPDPRLHLKTWLTWAPTVLLKLSPMVDRNAVARIFPTADLVVYLSRRREVKELLVRIPRGTPISPPKVLAVDVDAFGTEHYRILAEAAAVDVAPEIGAFLHDPDPVLRAAGAEEAWARQAGLQRAAPKMHLFTSQHGSSLPGGRHFAVESVHHSLPKDLGSASIVAKGFPERPEVLRKRWRLAESSERFLFALQSGNPGRKTFVVARRLTD
ncbi:MAG: THUMP-like domain-containing protein [Schleiferiaceae bacterium]